jgi:superfamily II DNA or RNA helicase
MNYKKLDKRIDDMLKYETDDYLVNINLKDEVSNKLLVYQFLHVFNLVSALRSNSVVVDGSDTGTGKTYTSIAVCKQLRLKPFIVCPKTIMSKWKQVCDLFDVKPVAIVNYETLKNGKQYDEEGNRIDCEYLEVDEECPDYFKWKLPRFSVVIFDEVHGCKNPKSLNGKLLKSTRNLGTYKNGIKVLMVSATLSDTPASFNLFGYMLGFYNNMRQATNWVKGMLKEDSCYIGSAPKLSAINKNIYPFKGSRLRISDLGGQFPSNQVSAECYDLPRDKIAEVNSLFKEITEGLTKIKSAKSEVSKGEILKDITKTRQTLELIKLPILESLIEEYLENNYSVVVFVNFTKTLMTLSNKFKTDCIVYGNQTTNQRELNIKEFQENKSKLILCNIKSGGTGISLHDTLGGHPRVSLISPNFSSTTLIQALGRIFRAGAKTPALQRIVYCANTCEEVICNRVKEKLKFTSKLNDNDLLHID